MNELIQFPSTVEGVLRQVMAGKPVARSDVVAFENEIKRHPQHLTAKDFTVYHHFAPDIYMRELHVPAGMITTGKIHKYPCLNILAKGKRATLLNGHMETVTAPHVHLSPAGMKRASMTFEDAVWITVHPNPGNCTDVDKLVTSLVCETEEEYQAFLDGERECRS